jgi:hypothetical protein
MWMICDFIQIVRVGWCMCLITGTKRGTNNIKEGNNTSDYIKRGGSLE